METSSRASSSTHFSQNSGHLHAQQSPMRDPNLTQYLPFLRKRAELFESELARIRANWSSLTVYANLHQLLGMHKITTHSGERFWCFREWMPAASDIWLTTDRLGFVRRGRYMFRRVPENGLSPRQYASPLEERPLPPELQSERAPLRAGLWELFVPEAELPHGTYIELRVTSPSVTHPERRVPAFAVWVEQDARIKEQWCARVWDPPNPYVFQYDGLQYERDAAEGVSEAPLPDFPRVYEAHVGMAQPADKRTQDSVGSYAAFTRDILPRIRENGYTAVQLMGIPEHPLYKSFGYQVSSYFAPSSRFGSADDFRQLVDEAHRLGLRIILDIPHSHSCPNTEQGLARYDTSSYLFGAQENQWGTASFDYAGEMTRRFLLSNCRYWQETFHVDGFRFDAVGNMIYIDHGFGDTFSSVERCFRTQDGKPRGDEAGMLYLQLANTLIHELDPRAVTIAEEFSGMPGMTSPPEEGGLGFDYRFAMGIPDFWGKFIVEDRPLGTMWHELTNHRPYERTISYVECHDQCINGKDAMIWRLIGPDMYEHMSRFSDSWNTSRGVALHKLMRLTTLGAAGHGYLTFMGNEFGHPEWIDDEDYAHRQWHLRDTSHLKYGGLGAFDRDMLALVARYPEAFREQPQFRYIHEEHRILAFQRRDLLFVFNFHDTRSSPTLSFAVPPGNYVEILSSDEPLYAGHGNVSTLRGPVEHFSRPLPDGHMISLYVPPLLGLVLERR